MIATCLELIYLSLPFNGPVLFTCSLTPLKRQPGIQAHIIHVLALSIASVRLFSLCCSALQHVSNSNLTQYYVPPTTLFIILCQQVGIGLATAAHAPPPSAL